ncbi:DUF2851 family protein [Pararcticibacter amylolyticus]|uniref:DUF2851 domain-containing protein n=1 Tax=Pararcticibacter amylolyticus TaxID=2173175 RepID=A0A2U2PES8_9SPHI|nr:DUF2851 family protein [Pararcticibacter amylolyticus]PWG79860.1 DUF2851 domain-containing protein [Pararcticibacter amylolyticus]
MSEDFICFIWKYRLFEQKNLTTTKGEPFEIVSPGYYNRDAGPDFTDIKLRIGKTLWAGNAEVHISSSDWDRHGHTKDPAYNNVILHIVYEHDRQIFRSDGTEPPAFELKNHIKPGIENRYVQLMRNMSWIPCEKQIGQVADLYMGNWLSRVLTTRLEEKSSEVLKLVAECRGSWDDAFYILLARNFGFKVNALPFELLARSLPQQILGKHRNSPLQIEALLFGQAGFLYDEDPDAYTMSLASEYGFLRRKYHLSPIDPYLWKFLRLHPQNFPTLRLAQFAALILKSAHLFSKILELADVKEIAKLFKDLPLDPYWETHYRLGKLCAKISAQPGTESVNNILLNTVAATVFTYGKYIGNDVFTGRALHLLETLPPETNSIIRGFRSIGVTPRNAGESQALLQLKKSWCDKKNCLLCNVGAKILNYD